MNPTEPPDLALQQELDAMSVEELAKRITTRSEFNTWSGTYGLFLDGLASVSRRRDAEEKVRHQGLEDQVADLTKKLFYVTGQHSQLLLDSQRLGDIAKSALSLAAKKKP